MDEDFDFDVPHYDFTTGEYPDVGDDWFFRGVEDEEMEEDPRSFDPSPSKKQRMESLQDEGNAPRRSPRLKVFGSAKYKTSEEMELEKIEEMRKQFAKSKKDHEIVYKKAIAPGKPMALKSSQPPTIPQGFRFQSDLRIKGTAEASVDTSVKDFTKMLRSTGPSNSLKPQGPKRNNQGGTLTKPQPFNLTKSTSSLQAAEKYTSTAEQVVAYNRAGLRSGAGAGPSCSSSGRPESPTLTIAKTPNLSTRGRSRSVKMLTREEEEEAEFEKHRQQQFKAHGVNHKILTQPQLGVRKIPAKPPTRVQEFNLHMATFHHVKASKDSGDEKTIAFHAHPVNQKVLDGPTGIKPADKRPLTVAQSPAFSLKNRLRSRERLQPPPKVEPCPEPQKVFSKPVPHMGVPFRPQLEHKHTVTKPFAVEQHSKDMLKKKELKIQQVLEEERKAREFHASLLPSDSPDQLPAKKTRPLTAVEPFSLAVDERGKKYQEEFKSKMGEEEGQAISKAQFHASSNKVVFKAPFVPEKSSRPLTEMSSFTLNTDQRSVKREFFNQQLKAHEAEVESLKRQREDRKVKEEKEVVAQLRQDMVPKATGIKKYKQVTPAPSDKPLTVAQSPCLQTNRLRSGRNTSTASDE